MLRLPPAYNLHATLDGMVMKQLKNAYNEPCSIQMMRYPELKIGLKDIAGVSKFGVDEDMQTGTAQSAFTCTEIYPLNCNILSDLDFNVTFSQLTKNPPIQHHPSDQVSTMTLVHSDNFSVPSQIDSLSIQQKLPAHSVSTNQDQPSTESTN